MNPVHNLTVRPTMPGAPATPAKGVQQAGSFKDFLLRSIEEVNSMQLAADRAVEKLASGQDVTPAEVLTAVQKADIAFRLMMQIRNKLIQAYQEVQNIRI
ncbi:MAG TPA: flagellar hook-basal body complex protein FliE [Planctomycetaceae bacterium]|nr:flagellar hook-basal body complex protein FliE [Planctomycetaceae bacterium]